VHAAANCLAVGSYYNGSATLPLAEKWNGTKWSIEASPSPHPSKPNVLSGVSCPSTTLCWAAGESIAGSATSPVVEQWNGKTWSVAS
jgi:hypothetical protein